MLNQLGVLNNLSQIIVIESVYLFKQNYIKGNLPKYRSVSICYELIFNNFLQ